MPRCHGVCESQNMSNQLDGLDGLDGWIPMHQEVNKHEQNKEAVMLEGLELPEVSFLTGCCNPGVGWCWLWQARVS